MRYCGMKAVIYMPAALRQLEALPQDVREQITEALHLYAVSGRGDIKQLVGRRGYRLRVGGYRILFDEDRQTILAIHIGKRDSTTYSRH